MSELLLRAERPGADDAAALTGRTRQVCFACWPRPCATAVSENTVLEAGPSLRLLD